MALFEGQSFAAALYGWRRMFQYPLVGLYVYVMPHWPPKAATWILRISLLALAFNTAVQLLLFAMGEKPSDSLAGMSWACQTGMVAPSLVGGLLLANLVLPPRRVL